LITARLISRFFTTWREKNMNVKIARRTFLRGAAALTMGVPLIDVLIACGGRGSTQQSSVPQTKKTMSLGDEVDTSLAKFGLQWIPDVHISYATVSGNMRRFFLSG